MASPRPSPKTDSLRLNKFLADGGLGSRRSCEELIRQGLVTLNGHPVTDLATRVLPDRDEVRVRGRLVSPEPVAYFLLNKPRGVICSSRDPQGRPTCLSLLPCRGVRLYTVGRLDVDSQGLILLTNDGPLAHRLMHPRFHVEKVYRVVLDAPLTRADRDRMLRGVHSRGEVLRIKAVAPGFSAEKQPVYEMVLEEGKNRHIRRVMEAVGRKTRCLERIILGPLTLDGLPSGSSRPLDREELSRLYELTGLTG